MFSNGTKRFAFIPLGTARSEEEGGRTSGGKGGVKDVEFVRYDETPTWIYRFHTGNKSRHNGVAY